MDNSEHLYSRWRNDIFTWIWAYSMAVVVFEEDDSRVSKENRKGGNDLL